ncbi:MAG TPA: metal-sensitive transcriptional regulator [Pseudobdellovibrionaceae bacterium]|nr:metal-sensitive transcriptional regulator [Pseudobdellovibrionaceae bacterium]
MTQAEKIKDSTGSKRATKNTVAQHASHADELARLRRIKGQVEGVENMIIDGRYCPDILLQVKAVVAALKSVELTILERHIRHCLSSAVLSGNKKETDRKIEEIITLLSRKGC